MAVTGYTTLRHVIYDLLTDFRQVHTDSKITEYQMLFWVLVHADRLRKLHIEKRDSGAYIVPFVQSILNGVFTLPGNIYDFHLDRGIAYIYAEKSGEIIHYARITKARVHRLYYREDEEPSEDNCYFYREGNIITLLGYIPAQVEVGLYLSFNPDDPSVDIDAPWDFPQDLIPILKRQILDLGVWALQVPRTLRSDGDDGQTAPLRKFLSVQDAVNPEIEQE